MANFLLLMASMFQAVSPLAGGSRISALAASGPSHKKFIKTYEWCVYAASTVKQKTAEAVDNRDDLEIEFPVCGQPTAGCG
jgi:hypothetical protein